MGHRLHAGEVLRRGHAELRHAIPFYFGATCTAPFSSLRLTHYPPVTEYAEGTFGIAPHTDSSFITLLAQNQVPGLQIRRMDGTWIGAPVVKGTFIVNTGNVLNRRTNGRFLSTPHRAFNTSSRPRYAIPYFFHPNADTVIECLPTCLGAGETAHDERAKRDGLGLQLMQSADSLRALGADTFELKLNKPYAFVIEALGRPGNQIPAMMPKRLAGLPADLPVAETVGSGPYTFDRAAWRPGDRAVFRCNPLYKPRNEPADWLAGGKVAKMDRIEAISMPAPATRVAALQAGEQAQPPPIRRHARLPCARRRRAVMRRCCAWWTPPPRAMPQRPSEIVSPHRSRPSGRIGREPRRHRRRTTRVSDHRHHRPRPPCRYRSRASCHHRAEACTQPVRVQPLRDQHQLRPCLAGPGVQP